MAWTYDRASLRYRDDASGRYLSREQQVTLRDRFIETMKERAAAIPTGDAAAWERQMRGLVKSTYIDMAVLGRGGRREMTPSDWGRAGNALRVQYQYLGRFADQLPTLSEAQVAARAGLYVASATTAYEKAAAVSAGSPDLPAFPGEQTCQANCRCSWEIVPTEAGWDCTWHAADDAGTCEECARNAADWAPLFVPNAEFEAVDATVPAAAGI